MREIAIPCKTGYRRGIEYRLVPRGRVYWLAYWCDCLIGPHWHEQGSYRTKAEAYAAWGTARNAEQRYHDAKGER